MHITPDYKYIIEVDILKILERFSGQWWPLDPLEGAQLSCRRSDHGRYGGGVRGVGGEG